MPEIAGEKQLSLVKHAVTSMRERILSGEYPPGSRLRLHTLAQETGASFIPVREALRVLETERLVETIPNRGARVVPLSMKEMNDLYAVRIILEAEAVRTASPIDAKTGKELLRILSRMRVAVKGNDTNEIIRLNQEFHFSIYRRSDSEWLLYLIDLLWNHTERYQRLSLSFRHDAADREHRAILKALVAGKSDEAATAMSNHLATTATLVAEYFKKSEV